MLILAVAGMRVRGEAMLELFQQTWPEITRKMPEIAEAGYDSLWLPNPAKGTSGTYSTGYDPFDPFDLGSTNQQGTIATAYGTQSQLIEMVQTAHRFGLRVYFDNVMNHRSSTVPGYPGGAPANFYPGLVPQDFHLQTISGGYQNWPNVSDWCSVQNVENQPLEGLADLANEPGTLNWNFGPSLGDTTNKPVFVRFPNRPDLYMDTNGVFLGAGWGGAGWRPFDGNGQPVPEDVSTYECRAVAWTLYMTKCDGFRLDAVKHVPVGFFGNETGQVNDPSFAGYTGAIQAMFDYVHGYGSNVTENGYVETDGNRNSLFDTEAPRNDAMLFGEYEPGALAAGNDFADYLNSGMRLLNFPLFTQMNNIFNGGTMAGMDGRDYLPPGGNCDSNGNFSANQAVNMPQTQDPGSCCPANEGFENTYFFMHEGLPMVYSDGFDHNTSGNTPIASYANYLGEFGDNSMPEIMHLHNQLARGGTWSRWSDQNVVLFERYDYREGNASQPQTQDVALVGLNDDTGYPGDIAFDDGVTRASDGYYLNPSNTTSTAVSNSRSQGIVVGFAPGSVLVQLADASPTGGRAYRKLLVHGATSSLATAQSTANAANPTQRLIYVGGQTIPSGGGAIELNLPSDAWVIYGYQWPQASQANPATNAIILRQNGQEVPKMLVYRTDGTNGDPKYSPLFPFQMRGSVDAYGNVITGANVSNLTYAIDIPIVTNGPFDILANSDASAGNAMIKLDGGIDLNSQMGLGATQSLITNFVDLRDNPPGYADDVFLGYENTAFQFRNGPEKFASRNILSNSVVAVASETYVYTVGGGLNFTPGTGYGQGITNQTALWVLHNPTNLVTASIANPPYQMNPLSPNSGQPEEIWLEMADSAPINSCFVYYTTDGTTPDGGFGVGKSSTLVTQAAYVTNDVSSVGLGWWRAVIPGQAAGITVRYKIGAFVGGSANPGRDIAPISDAEVSGSKLFGLTQFAITNFNPSNAVVWLHNDLNTNNMKIGLTSGFHILRSRVFLPRPGESSVYNTFLQTFYYAGPLPNGVVVYPQAGSDLTTSGYTVVVRVDDSVANVQFNIEDSNPGNDDGATGQLNGNGLGTNGQPSFAYATKVTPNQTLDLQYPNDLQEFRFVYTNIPSSGTATLVLKLNDYASGVLTNRYAILKTQINTMAPVQLVQISNPATNGTVLKYTGTNSSFLVQACFSSGLASVNTNFNVLINGTLQPQSAYVLRPEGAVPGCTGYKSLLYNWNNPDPGTNIIQVIDTNAFPPVSDSRAVVVAPPLQAFAPTIGTHSISWNSVPGVNYQVYSTTNLNQPFQPLSGLIPGTGAVESYQDPMPAPQKFYEIKMVP